MIYILGLDGLEYKFVEKWDLTNIKQNYYGKIEVPIDKDTLVPLSPEVWASFLTGKMMQNLNFSNDLILRNFRHNFLNILKFVRKHIPLRLGLGRVVRGISLNRFPTLEEETFLDIFNSKIINVPYYNYDHKEFLILKELRKNHVSVDTLINELFKLWEKRKKLIISESKKLNGVNMVFAFENCSDSIQHFGFLNPVVIKKFYLNMDRFVSKLKKIIGDCLFIIISDHGFDINTEKHSLYGFYSSNKPIKPEPNKITDFYNYFIRVYDTARAC